MNTRNDSGFLGSHEMCFRSSSFLVLAKGLSVAAVLDRVEKAVAEALRLAPPGAKGDPGAAANASRSPIHG